MQQGLEPADWKPLSSVGIGVREIRVHTGREHRVVYVARFAEAIYVLHAFQKKSKFRSATTKHDLDLIEARLSRATELHALNISKRS